MGKEILIATITSDSLCQALITSESMSFQLTLKGANCKSKQEMHFTSSDLNTHVSQLNVILTSVLYQVTVNCVLTFLISIQAIVYKPV